MFLSFFLYSLEHYIKELSNLKYLRKTSNHLGLVTQGFSDQYWNQPETFLLPAQIFPFLKTTTLLLYSIYNMILISDASKGHVLKA